MKICVYEARPDERADLERQAALHGVELTVTDAVPTLENADLAAGCAGVSTLGQGRLGAALLDAGCATAFERVAVNDVFGHSGKGMELVDEFGLRAKDIAAAAKRAIARK